MLDVAYGAIIQSARMSEADRILDRLRGTLDKARKRVETLESLLRAFERVKASLPESEFLNLLGTMTSDINRLLPSEGEPSASESEGHDQPQRVRGDLSPGEVADLARDTLLSVGRPLKRGQLVRELEQRGVPLAGADKNKNLGTILWRHQEMFVTLPKLGYWARGVPLKGAYDPETFVEVKRRIGNLE